MGRLEVLDLTQGLELRATSWVGRVVLGDLTITIQPKITGAPMLHLLRYSYGLGKLKLFQQTSFVASSGSFQDLICQELADQVNGLMAQGLHRDYQRTAEDLASPRGRPNITEYVNRVGTATATLPYIHYPRTEATLLNRVLLAGLHLASGVCNDRELRGRIRRLAHSLDVRMCSVRLDSSVLRQAEDAVDRRTATYRPALTLIGLLLNSLGMSLGNRHEATFPMPGFLFDMNRFFQALVSRFLHDYLQGFTVRDEYQLKGVFTYAPDQNPNHRRSPTPRPDFVVLDGQKIAAVLDAKYRDLWENNLPESMLYQLAVYALLQDSPRHRSVILYPTIDATAVDQVITLQEPIRGSERAQVVLRPVNLLALEQLLRLPSDYRTQTRRSEFAKHLAFAS